MQQINNKIQNTIYGYNPNEFLPIFMDGRLDNRNAFIAYKTKRVLSTAGRGIGSAFVGFLTAVAASNKQ